MTDRTDAPAVNFPPENAVGAAGATPAAGGMPDGAEWHQDSAEGSESATLGDQAMLQPGCEPVSIVPADHAADAAPVFPAPEPTTATDQMSSKETETMASTFDYNRIQETATNQAQQFQAGVQQAADQVRRQSEEAVRQGQAAFAQAAERSREAMDRGMKALDEFNAQARGNADAWMASSRAAAQGLETIVQQAAEFSRKTFETATAAMRTMASARTPTDVMQAQNDFAKAQFDTIVSEFSRLTETMMKVTSSVFEPLSSHMSEAAHKATETMKNTVTPNQP